MEMDITRESEEQRACYQCERAEKCPYFSTIETSASSSYGDRGDSCASADEVE